MKNIRIITSVILLSIVVISSSAPVFAQGTSTDSSQSDHGLKKETDFKNFGDESKKVKDAKLKENATVAILLICLFAVVLLAATAIYKQKKRPSKKTKK